VVTQIIGPKSQKYHIQDLTEIAQGWQRYLTTKETKYFIIQERDVRFRITPHFHPYVGRLSERLLRGGTLALQSADTEYALDGSALPESVEVSLGVNTKLTLPAGSRISMLTAVQATVGGGQLALPASMQYRLAAPAEAVFDAGLRATLIEEMKAAPSRGAEFALLNDFGATLFGDTAITLSNETQLTLHDGTVAKIPAQTKVILQGGSEMPLLTGTNVTLLRSKPKPRELFAPLFSAELYKPTQLVGRPYPVKDLDFTANGAYAVYNWELFFHVPLTMAIHLSKNQRFAEAQHWFHYLFDPTDDSDGPTPERFWKVRPFQYTDVTKVEEILVNLVTGGDEALRTDTIRSIEAWEDSPFRPHVIARYRQQAYMYKTVMAYLDNLIDWGDSLFRQDTGEAVDEALMIYVLAANILGPRPQAVPRKGTIRPQTYDNLRQDLRQFGTVLRDVEADIPFDVLPLPKDVADDDRIVMARSLGKALYFGVPRNDKLLTYWDTIEDRLFKIRNSLNIRGVFRQLALFEPPIDPALLARAAAAGLDVGAIVNGLNQPLPLVRFQVLVQKALEIAQEVKSLGNNLLSAMEKEDGEAMAILRARHERVVLEMAEQVKYAQLQEAAKSKENLVQSLATVVHRFAFYERQLGKTVEEVKNAVPALDELDKESLTKLQFAMLEPSMAEREIEIDIATDAFAQAAQALYGGKLLSSHEVRESLFLEGAQLATDIANILGVASSIASVVPQFEVSAEPWGVGGATNFGGQNVASGIQAFAGAARGIGDRLNFEARRAARIDSFARRERDWAFQSNQAAGEINQIFKQLRAAQLREAIADRELVNHRKQMAHAKEVESFLNEEGANRTGKATNRALYGWMKREVKGLYGQCFQFAFDVARRAERALQHELGDPEQRQLQFTYLAGKEGLLAGEKLYLDLKRMEITYQELNQRDYELTRHVSLLQVDPLALLQLRTTGLCTVRLPEELFDMDGPGHYFRRIKSVAVTLPSVVGPYTSVNCTLTLLKSSIRKTQVLLDGSYARQSGEDPRFDDYFGSLQSIVTSGGQNDGGLFETNLRDERYLPFEGAGAISEWHLQLPSDPSQGQPRQFDYDTISDVILHIRYTAREGGEPLRKEAIANLAGRIDSASATGSVRLFSVRHEFPTEWWAFQHEPKVAGKRFKLEITLRPEHYPYWSRGRLGTVNRIDILARSTIDAPPAPPPPAALDVFDKVDDAGGAAKTDVLAKDNGLGNLLRGKLTNVKALAKPDDTMKLFFDNRSLDDLWIAITWGK
jgi:hypothetical protein